MCRKDLNGQVKDKTNDQAEPRFEIFGNRVGSSSGTDDSGSGNNDSSSRNPSGRPQQTNRSHSVPGNNPVLQSLNQILDPLLSGLSGAGNDSIHKFICLKKFSITF